uniref:Secreted protein n=1 Tax=Arundo donax TaxID=35708 RepID=A0A0A8Y485_ARUDO
MLSPRLAALRFPALGAQLITASALYTCAPRPTPSMSQRSVCHGWLMSGGGVPEGDTAWARAPTPPPMRACTMTPTVRSSGAARWPDGSMERSVQGPWWPPPTPFSMDRVVTRSSPMAGDSRLGWWVLMAASTSSPPSPAAI